MQVVNVQDFAGSTSTTAGIQEALDSLPKAGGTVYLPPGRYALRRSVEVRSNVTIRGEGPATVITRPKGVVTIPLTRPADGARTTVSVTHTNGLRLGDEVYVGDEESHGWWASHAIIRAVRRASLGLEVLHGKAEYKFLPKRHAHVTNWFPAFWLREVHDVTIQGVTIDGGIRRHTRETCDFVVAAIHARNCDAVRVLNVTVRNWPGDGIGVQGGAGAFVSGCLVENCAGHGFHPGTGITQSIWADNIARRNTGDGLFFCLRVTHSTVRGNVLVGNRGHGIGGLSDPDQYNVVVGNVCAENGRHGIDADRALGDVIRGNVCRNNSRRAPGAFAGVYLAGHRNCIVTGNVLVDDQKRPTQRRGLVERDPAGTNIVRDNRFEAVAETEAHPSAS